MPGNKGQQALRSEWNSEENKDVVILHCFPRSEKCPSVSPFVLKLETFLRLHDIKYKPETECPAHAETGKTPWITYNGEDVADSQLIIEYLTEKRGLASSADSKDKVLARGIRAILEDNFVFCRAAEMFVFGNPEDLDFMPTFVSVKAINKLITKRFMAKVAKQPIEQGIGKHKKEVVVKIAEGDLEAVSLALGDKQFVLGDEPSEVDAVVFGVLAVTLHLGPANHEITKLLDKFDNLKAYVERVKEKLWPDWDQLCQEAAEAKAPASPNKKKEDKAADAKDEKEEESGEKKEEGKEDEKKEEDSTEKEEKKEETPAANGEAEKNEADK